MDFEPYTLTGATTWRFYLNKEESHNSDRDSHDLTFLFDKEESLLSVLTIVFIFKRILSQKKLMWL